MSRLLSAVLPKSKQVLTSAKDELPSDFESDNEESLLEQIPGVVSFDMPDRRFYVAVQKMPGLNYQLNQNEKGNVVVSAKWCLKKEQLAVIGKRLKRHTADIQEVFQERTYITELLPPNQLHQTATILSTPDDEFMIASFEQIIGTSKPIQF